MHNLRHLNRVTTGLSYLLQRDRVWGQPVFFTIETINTCNFRCIYCPQSDQANHFVNGRGVMSLEDFKHIIANLRSCFDVRIVSLHRDCEPLLNKRLEAYIAHLMELGTKSSSWPPDGLDVGSAEVLRKSLAPGHVACQDSPDAPAELPHACR